MNIITSINIDLRDEYYDPFTDGQRIIVLNYDGYLRLLDLLTPEQRAALHALSDADRYAAISGYVA